VFFGVFVDLSFAILTVVVFILASVASSGEVLDLASAIIKYIWHLLVPKEYAA